jgi:hypothetical protein
MGELFPTVMLDFGSVPAARRISKVMQHYEPMRARVAEVLLRAQDAIVIFVVVGKFDETIEADGPGTYGGFHRVDEWAQTR